MTITTGNFTVNPQDGWVQIAAGATSFLRLSKFPHRVPVWLAFAASAPSLVGVAGTGTVTFSTANPTAGHTVTVGSETYTFVASGATGFQVNIGANFTATAQAFLAVVNAQSTLVNATGGAAVITLTSKVLSSAGNYALATNDANIAVSGANMTGASNPNAGFRWECEHTFFESAIGVAVWARISKTENGPVKLSVYND